MSKKNGKIELQTIGKVKEINDRNQREILLRKK